MRLADLPSKTTRQIRLHDGRLLAYAEYGDPAGRPVIFFHGTPGSRLFHYLDESIAQSLGARIITPDRPGFGLSDFKPGRTLLDWPDDVMELADALQIDRFAVAGTSGGAPYVAACALKIPHRLTRAVMISSAAPIDAPAATKGMVWLNRLLFSSARYSRMLAKLSWGLMNFAYHQSPERFFDFEAKLSPETEKALLKEPDVRAMLMQDYAEATRMGARGTAWEMTLLAHPWGFRLQDITMEVYLWHGEADVRTPLGMGKYLAGTIPNCRAIFAPGEGHDVMYHHWKEILSVLTSWGDNGDDGAKSSRKRQTRPKRRTLSSEAKTVPAESCSTEEQVRPAPEKTTRRKRQLVPAGSGDNSAVQS